jgi:hypothetical protein
MIKKLLPFLLLTSFGYAQVCVDDPKVEELMSPCQKAYYKFAPVCEVGDSTCLSLILQGLVTKNLFNYRPNVRKEYNTPLKQKKYRTTEGYRVQYKAMLKDLEGAKNATFCAEMDAYWLYDLNYNGFLFNSHTLIPKSPLFRVTNISKVLNYDKVSVSEREATEIESWGSLASSKFIFFRLSERQTGFVQVKITHYAWFTPNISFDPDGEILLTYDEGCAESSHFIYKHKR